MRFCSRCGFPLEGVSALLASGGLLPAAPGEPGQPSPRKQGVRQGLAAVLIGFFVVALLAVLSEELHLIPDAFIPLGAVIFFMGGIVRIIYALAFQEGAPRGRKSALAPGAPSSEQLGARSARALPPQQSVPAGAYVPPRARTAEITPPSVTESTTRLLDDEGRRDERTR